MSLKLEFFTAIALRVIRGVWPALRSLKLSMRAFQPISGL